MSPEKQRIAIAEACGWKRNVDGLGYYQGVHPALMGGRAIPDYLNDLNAMHEAEKVLNQMQSRANAYHLAESEQNETWASCHIWHQSAAQRAEAFLRTLGLWEEEANTTKFASSTSAATEESSVSDNSGNETDFVTKSMTADEIMAGKMAKDLHQIRKQIYALGKYQIKLLEGGGWDMLFRMYFDAERLDSYLRRRWNTPTPNPHNQ